MNPKSRGWAQMVLNFLFPTCSSKAAKKVRKQKQSFEILNCTLENEHMANVKIIQILCQFVYDLIRGGRARKLLLWNVNVSTQTGCGIPHIQHWWATKGLKPGFSRSYFQFHSDQLYIIMKVWKNWTINAHKKKKLSGSQPSQNFKFLYILLQ